MCQPVASVSSCEGGTPVRSADKTSCINASTCTNEAGHANVNNDCTDCTDDYTGGLVRQNLMCISKSICTGTAMYR